MNKIQDEINDQIAKIQYDKAPSITNSQVDIILEALEKIDKDLKPMIIILGSLIKNLQDGKIKMLYVLQILKFYGIGNTDILTIRPKYIIESCKLVKKPFLKKKQIESINILLEAMGLQGNINE
jgi:hypothetical protein